MKVVLLSLFLLVGCLNSEPQVKQLEVTEMSCFQKKKDKMSMIMFLKPFDDSIFWVINFDGTYTGDSALAFQSNLSIYPPDIITNKYYRKVKCPKKLGLAIYIKEDNEYNDYNIEMYDKMIKQYPDIFKDFLVRDTRKEQ